MAKQHQPDDDDTPQGDWVIAAFVVRYSVRVVFVCEHDGRPAIDWHATSEVNQAYRWNSYHAARKFMKAHDRLSGYEILNLSEMIRASEEHDRAEEAWLRHDDEAKTP